MVEISSKTLGTILATLEVAFNRMDDPDFCSANRNYIRARCKHTFNILKYELGIKEIYIDELPSYNNKLSLEPKQYNE
jgi:hypothetical protein